MQKASKGDTKNKIVCVLHRMSRDRRPRSFPKWERTVFAVKGSEHEDSININFSK